MRMNCGLRLGLVVVGALLAFGGTAHAELVMSIEYHGTATGGAIAGVTKDGGSDVHNLTIGSAAVGKSLTFKLYATVNGISQDNVGNAIGQITGGFWSHPSATIEGVGGDLIWAKANTVAGGPMEDTWNSTSTRTGSGLPGGATGDADGDKDIVGTGGTTNDGWFFVGSLNDGAGAESPGVISDGMKLYMGTLTYTINSVGAIAANKTMLDFMPAGQLQGAPNFKPIAFGDYHAQVDGSNKGILYDSMTWYVDGVAKNGVDYANFMSGRDTSEANRVTLLGVTMTPAGTATTTAPVLNLASVSTTASRLMKGATTTMTGTITNTGDANAENLLWTATGNVAPGPNQTLTPSPLSGAVVRTGGAGTTSQLVTGTFVGDSLGTQILTLAVSGNGATNTTLQNATLTATTAVLENRQLAVDSVGTGQRVLVGTTLPSNIRSNGGIGNDNFHATVVNLSAVPVASNGDVSVAADAAKTFNDQGLSAGLTVGFTSPGVKSGSISVMPLLSDGEDLSVGATVQDAFLNYNVAAVEKRVFNAIAPVTIAGKYLVGATVSGSATATSQTGEFFTRPMVNGAAVTSDSISLPVSLTLSNYGLNTDTGTFPVAPEGGIAGEGTYNNLTVQVNANAGEGVAKLTADSGKFAGFDGLNALSATVVGATYGPLSSKTTKNIENKIVGTEARINGLAGTPGEVLMNWRTRAIDETPGTVDPALFRNSTWGLISDVVDLHTVGQSDRYLLEMTYDPALLPSGSTEVEQAAGKGIYVAWLNDLGSLAEIKWEHAGDPAKWLASLPGNLGSLEVGNWGVNTGTHTAWVVTNHNSQYAVVPEPATWALLLVGGVALVPYFRRRKVS